MSRKRGIARWFACLRGFGFSDLEQDETALFVNYAHIDGDSYKELSDRENYKTESESDNQGKRSRYTA